MEDELWKRFSSARTQFDRHRRQFFSQLDQAQSEAKRIKEALIAEAEALSSSVDWSRTSSAYRELMNRWKAAPRASRKEDDALWARFRAAQQVSSTPAAPRTKPRMPSIGRTWPPRKRSWLMPKRSCP